MPFFHLGYDGAIHPDKPYRYTSANAVFFMKEEFEIPDAVVDKQYCIEKALQSIDVDALHLPRAEDIEFIYIGFEDGDVQIVYTLKGHHGAICTANAKHIREEIEINLDMVSNTHKIEKMKERVEFLEKIVSKTTFTTRKHLYHQIWKLKIVTTAKIIKDQDAGQIFYIGEAGNVSSDDIVKWWAEDALDGVNISVTYRGKTTEHRVPYLEEDEEEALAYWNELLFKQITYEKKYVEIREALLYIDSTFAQTGKRKFEHSRCTDGTEIRVSVEVPFITVVYREDELTEPEKYTISTYSINVTKDGSLFKFPFDLEDVLYSMRGEPN